jgi:hypothetical protein
MTGTEAKIYGDIFFDSGSRLPKWDCAISREDGLFTFIEHAKQPWTPFGLLPLCNVTDLPPSVYNITLSSTRSPDSFLRVKSIHYIPSINENRSVSREYSIRYIEANSFLFNYTGNWTIKAPSPIALLSDIVAEHQEPTISFTYEGIHFYFKHDMTHSLTLISRRQRRINFSMGNGSVKHCPDIR